MVIEVPGAKKVRPDEIYLRRQHWWDQSWRYSPWVRAWGPPWSQIDWSIPSCMRQYGVTRTFLKANQWVKCPACGYEFNLMYARSIACQGCPQAVLGCDLMRCPKCDFEFRLTDMRPVITSREDATRMAKYVARALRRYHEDFGESPRR